jgi:hypothetical protein
VALAVSARHHMQRLAHMEKEYVVVKVELDSEQAWALAQLVKRIGWRSCRSMAEDAKQTSLMIQATERLRRALAEAGYAPR